MHVKYCLKSLFASRDKTVHIFPVLVANRGKNAEVSTTVLTSCNRLADTNKPTSGCIRMAYGQLVDDKSVVSCYQTCCKLIVKTCNSHSCCKLFEQVVTSLQMTHCNKRDFNRLVAT